MLLPFAFRPRRCRKRACALFGKTTVAMSFSIIIGYCACGTGLRMRISFSIPALRSSIASSKVATANASAYPLITGASCIAPCPYALAFTTAIIFLFPARFLIPRRLCIRASISISAQALRNSVKTDSSFVFYVLYAFRLFVDIKKIRRRGKYSDAVFAHKALRFGRFAL